MKRRRVESAAYDEASSSDSEEDSSGDHDDDSSSASPHGGHAVVDKLKPADSDEEASYSDSSSGDGQEDSESSDTEEPGKQASSRGLEESDGDGDASSEEDHHDEADMPLQERIQRKEAQGLSLQNQRERKRSALEIANKRLAKYKKSKAEGTPTPDATGGGGDGGPLKKKKKSKHAPTEVSSKRSEFYRRGAPRLNESGVGVEIGARRYKPLDPRTSNLSGHLNEEQFEKNYEFLQDMRNKEISQLKKKIVALNKTGKKGKRMRRQLNISVADDSLEDDEERLRQLKQERADFERSKVVRSAKQAVKRKLQSEVEEGKSGVFFLKRKEKQRLEFEAKMEELRKRGGHKAVEKAMAKRRQKAKSRDAGLFAK